MVKSIPAIERSLIMNTHGFLMPNRRLMNSEGKFGRGFYMTIALSHMMSSRSLYHYRLMVAGTKGRVFESPIAHQGFQWVSEKG
jgi:hypothetical protein